MSMCECVSHTWQVVSLRRKLDKERTGTVLINDVLAALGVPPA